MSTKTVRKDMQSQSKPAKRNESVSEAKEDGGSPKKRRKLSTGPTQSCHQCRQSILSNKGISELKAGKARRQCDTCTTYWCENCLENRYGLSFVEISGKRWSCPKCLKTCNCSICRKRAGMLATGILTPLAKEAGFSSVNDFLSKGTGAIAECLQWKEEPGSETSPQKPGKSPAKAGRSPAKGKPPQPAKRKRGSSTGAVAADGNEDADSAPAAKRTKKRGAASEGRRRISFELDLQPKKAPRRRTSLEEKRVSADEYRRQLAERQEQLARDRKEEKERKKQGKQENVAHEKELKKRALEEVRRRDAEEKEKERCRSKELKQSELEEMRRNKAEEIERQKEAKRQEVEKLRLERAASKQQLQEEHKIQMEDMRKQKATERERELEEKKLELTKLREEKAHAKDQEREMRKLQLETLRAHVSQQKQAVKDLLSVGTVGASRSKPNFSRTPSNTSNASSDSESGVDCDFIVPPVVDVETIGDICIDVELPELPAWVVPIPLSQYNNLLLVSEFLAAFSSRLGLREGYSAEKLAQTFLARTTLPTLHLALMKALLKAEAEEQEESEDDGFDEEEEVPDRVQLDQLPKLTSSSCQQVMELYLAMAGYKPDSSVKGAGRRKMSADERTICDKLPVLAFLCERLIGMKYIAEAVNETSEDLVELQRKHRVSERVVCKQINEELKAWTAEQLMARKDKKSTDALSELPSASEKFSKQIAEVRSKQQCEHDACASLVRGQLLGRDRTGRAYWFLQSVSGLLVEEECAEAATSSKAKSSNPFRICHSAEQLDTILDALCMDLPAEATLSHQLKLRSGTFVSEESD